MQTLIRYYNKGDIKYNCILYTYYVERGVIMEILKEQSNLSLEFSCMRLAGEEIESRDEDESGKGVVSVE